MRAMADEAGQQQFGRLQRLIRVAIAQFRVGQEIGRDRERASDTIRHREWAGRFDEQEVAALAGWLRHECGARLAIIERDDRRIDLGVLGAKELRAVPRRVGTGQRPRLVTPRQHLVQARPQRRLVRRTDLESAFRESRTEHLDVRLYPQRHERVAVCHLAPGLALMEQAALLEIGEASRHRAECHIRLVGDRPVRRVRELGTNQERHHRLDPAFLRPGRRGRLALERRAPFHVDEEAGAVEMRVPGEIEVIHAGAFEGRGLLRTDVRREKQDLLVVTDRRLALRQPIDDNPHVLVPEVRDLREGVGSRTTSGLPRRECVERHFGIRSADVHIRKPPFQGNQILVYRYGTSRHVHYLNMFINNEHYEYQNIHLERALDQDGRPGARRTGDRYVSIGGTATVVHDEVRFQSYWNPSYRAWFPDGPDDPDSAIFTITIERIDYWDVPTSRLVRLWDAATALIIGQVVESGERTTIDLQSPCCA